MKKIPFVTKEKIEKIVPEYMIPGKVVYLENMPMNANGKIDRKWLKDNYDKI